MVVRKSYRELLRHPKWQRRRLDILARSNFACAECGAADQTLNVHHKLYRKGAMPWEYDDSQLEALCEQCHAQHHEDRQRIDLALSMLDHSYYSELAGYIAGRHFLCMRHEWRKERPSELVPIADAEYAVGFGAAFGFGSSESCIYFAKGDLTYEEAYRRADQAVERLRNRAAADGLLHEVM